LNKLCDGGVTAVFTGHYHQNAGGSYKGMEEVVTTAIGPALGDDPSGLRIVKVTENKMTHKYYNLDDIPITLQ